MFQIVDYAQALLSMRWKFETSSNGTFGGSERLSRLAVLALIT